MTGEFLGLLRVKTAPVGGKLARVGVKAVVLKGVIVSGVSEKLRYERYKPGVQGICIYSRQ